MFALVISIILLCVLLLLSYKIYLTTSCGICKYSGHLVGKVVIVTGASSGLGFETAKDLSQRGARLILACRNMEVGAMAKEEIINCSHNKDVHLRKLDLESFTSIRNFVDNVYQNEKQIDVLVNNAGIYTKDNRKTEDGLLVGMQVNYFGPFLLTLLLLPLLKKSESSRILNVSSCTYRFGQLDLENLNKEGSGYFWYYKIYFTAKLCNILIIKELSRQLQGTTVTANCLDPGVVNTKMLYKVDILLVRMFFKIVCIFLKTPWQGAQTTIYLAVSPEVQNLSGCFFKDCRLANLNSTATNLDTARKLWEISEKLVKFK